MMLDRGESEVLVHAVQKLLGSTRWREAERRRMLRRRYQRKVCGRDENKRNHLVFQDGGKALRNMTLVERMEQCMSTAGRLEEDCHLKRIHPV